RRVLARIGAVEAEADGTAVGRDGAVPVRAGDRDRRAGLRPGAVPTRLHALARGRPGEGEGPAVDRGRGLVGQRDGAADAVRVRTAGVAQRVDPRRLDQTGRRGVV